MMKVAIYERHPSVLEGLLRRLEHEPALRIVGGHVDLFSFATGLKADTPDVAVVSAFGGGAIPAANLAAQVSATTRLVALVPGTRRNERLGYPPEAEFLVDGPRGDLLVQRLLGIDKELGEGSASRTAP